MTPIIPVTSFGGMNESRHPWSTVGKCCLSSSNIWKIILILESYIFS
jgi:hypothetical protein